MAKEKTIHDIARELFDKHGTREAACAAMIKAAGKDKALADRLLNLGAHQVIKEAVISIRREVWAAPGASNFGVDAIVAASARTIMDFPLPSGIALREAMRSDCDEAAHEYSVRAIDMGHKARWLSAIAERLDDEQTVADVFDAAALMKLKDEVQ